MGASFSRRAVSRRQVRALGIAAAMGWAVMLAPPSAAHVLSSAETRRAIEQIPRAEADLACTDTPGFPTRYRPDRSDSCVPMPACPAEQVFSPPDGRCVTATAAEVQAARCNIVLPDAMQILVGRQMNAPDDANLAALTDRVADGIMQTNALLAKSGLPNREPRLFAWATAVGQVETQRADRASAAVQSCAFKASK